jgi:hypothetical protein
MPIHVNSPGWRIPSATRGGPAAATPLKGLPGEFLTGDSHVSEETVIEPAPATRGRPAAGGPLDVTVDLEPGRAAVLALRHPSGALTFHRPIAATTRGARGPAQVRFQVTVHGGGTTRGLAGTVVKAIVVKVAKLGGEKLVSLALAKLVEAFEKRSWASRGLKEGWLHVTRDTLAAQALVARAPVSPARSLLFIHGTFSNAAAGFNKLASTDFFERVKNSYDDRIFAFNHFSLHRTPEENVRLLLEGLPEHATTFDVVTHSRGGLVLRTLVERARVFGPLSKRFTLGRAVLVAAPNNGTPLATPDRWDHTVGWIANLLEMFPDNPFTIGAEFVANGLVWLANHAAGDIPGLHAMDGGADPIRELQTAADPPATAYSALVANYNPPGALLRRLVDAGLDQFFGSANDLVVPSEGGWSVFRSTRFFIPASRIGCFGPGGNLPGDSVTHVDFFRHQETADFLVAALEGRAQALTTIDPRRTLPDRRFVRGAPVVDAASAIAAEPQALPAPRPSRARRRPAEVQAGADAAASLGITIANGDLSFESSPLLLGHYVSTKLTGTEEVVNELIGGAMEYSLKLGLYPVDPGSHQVFINSYSSTERETFIPRPQAVIVAGLGPEGALQAADLVKTVRLAVVGWARRISEDASLKSMTSADARSTRRRTAAAASDPSFDVAATLLGSGGTGISAGQAAQLITQGVLEANELLASESGDRKARWPRCRRLRLIELYLDRAAEAWRALHLKLEVTPNKFSLDPTIDTGRGGHVRPSDTGYRGAPYDFITVETARTKGGIQTFEFNLDTRRARSEVRAKTAQSALLGELVAAASNDQNRDQRIGRTLSRLLVPQELADYLAGTAGIQMSLDPDSAGIPWELLDINPSEGRDQRPWAIRVQLLRKLRLGQFREHVIDTDPNDDVLVIGEPQCPPDFPRLDGARMEARRVRDVLAPRLSDPQKVTLLAAESALAAGPDAQAVVNTLFEKAWRIVHIAGHGMPGDDAASGGVVLSNGTFLGASEIKSMGKVPELVFVNCCYLAQVDDQRTGCRPYNRAQFASGVAGALMEIGVRCVVAAGWAVDDDAASEFATTFYDAILRGQRFIDAVGEARQAAWERYPGVNTWAAYQCYGDPDWRFAARAPDPNQIAVSDVDEFATIATDIALTWELQRIHVDTESHRADRYAQVNKLQKLEQKFGERWGRKGKVAEGFARAYAEAGNLESAVKWYDAAVNAPDATASMRAPEQLNNLRSRLGWELVERAIHHRRQMATQRAAAAGAGGTPETRAAAQAALVDADERLADAIKAGRALIDQALPRLQELVKFRPTMERHSLVGSTLKRRAMLNLAANQRQATLRDLRQMRAAYDDALRVGQSERREQGDHRIALFYPAANSLAADIVLKAGNRSVALDRTLVSHIERYLESRSKSEVDFWSVATEIELKQYRAIGSRTLAARLGSLKRLYQDLYARGTSARMWSSVYDSGYLVLNGYATAQGKIPKLKSRRERAAAEELLTLLRRYAHPGEE